MALKLFFVQKSYNTNNCWPWFLLQGHVTRCATITSQFCWGETSVGVSLLALRFRKRKDKTPKLLHLNSRPFLFLRIVSWPSILSINIWQFSGKPNVYINIQCVQFIAGSWSTSWDDKDLQRMWPLSTVFRWSLGLLCRALGWAMDIACSWMPLCIHCRPAKSSCSLCSHE